MSDSNAPAIIYVWMDKFTDDVIREKAISQNDEAHRRLVDGFLQSVERRALYMLELGTRHREEALDLLQDCMLRFVRRYAKRPAEEWAPLFFRVVSNALIDWQRRRAVRGRVIAIWPWRQSADRRPDSASELAVDLPERDSLQPDRITERRDELESLRAALTLLPTRQRQTFLLREWQGLSVAETAFAMGVSEGSVKTHLYRAHSRLRELLHAEASRHA